jgi:hypothetical protein
MAYEYTIEQHPRLVYLRRRGEADVAGWRETMLRMTTDPAFARGTPILFDVTASDSNPPSGQSQVLAAMWRDLVGDSYVAMVASKAETQALLKHLEVISGGHVRAFDNVDEARAWLTCAGSRQRQ